MKKFILLMLVISFMGSCTKVVYKDPMAVLHCEESTFIGYMHAYLGDEKYKAAWKSFINAQYKSPYRNSCGEWNPHYCGHRIFIEGNSDLPYFLIKCQDYRPNGMGVCFRDINNNICCVERSNK